MVEILCPHCEEEIELGDGIYGLFECPFCNEDFEYESPIPEFQSANFSFPTTVSQNNVSIVVSILGVILGVLAIVVFFNAFNFDSLCPEDGRSTTMIDGEEVITCNNDDRMLWEQQWVKQVFYACCLIVPGSLLLTVTGYNLRKKKSRFGTLSSELEANNPPDSLSETKVVKALQAAAMFFGIGISSIVAIIGIALLVLFIVFISAFFSR
tara:strand:+ start:360 stop:989 length:630 start_codon:yes stop_codon:yes gene_type:complete